MIDFRYHLVSLASVLIALAVGIVLGAGPLKEDIGNTLTSEVTKLREEKASLRTQLDSASAAAQTSDAYQEAVLPEVVTNHLVGRTVAVVALPQADSALVATTSTTLQNAGASIVGDVSVDATWVNPNADAAATRADLGSTLLRRLRIGPSAVPNSQDIDSVLGAILVNPGGGAEFPPGQANDHRLAAWKSLRDAGLVSGTIAKQSTANTVVLVAGPMSNNAPDDGQARAAGLAALAQVMDGSGMGAVLVSDAGRDPGDGTSVVASARQSGDNSTLSTVDDAGSAMGQSSTVFALEDRYAGTSGQYGLLPGATAPFADVPGS